MASTTVRGRPTASIPQLQRCRDTARFGRERESPPWTSRQVQMGRPSRHLRRVLEGPPIGHASSRIRGTGRRPAYRPPCRRTGWLTARTLAPPSLAWLARTTAIYDTILTARTQIDKGTLEGRIRLVWEGARRVLWVGRSRRPIRFGGARRPSALAIMDIPA